MEASKMSDLAPFVATVLRDKVVNDLDEEITTLKDKIKTLEEEWTVSITGPGGAPVYTTGKLSMRDVFLACFGRDHQVDVKLDDTEVACPFDKLLEFELTVKTSNNGATVTYVMGDRHVIWVENGRLPVRWTFVGDSPLSLQEVSFNLPNPEGREEGQPLMEALRLEREITGNDAPILIRFDRVLYDTRDLVALLGQDGEDAA